MAKDDRTARDQLIDFLSDGTGGGDIRTSAGAAVQDVKPPRTRNLRPTFRPVPGTGSGSDSVGFPGTRAFAPRRPDPRAAGPDIQPAATRPVGPPAPSESHGDPKRRRPAVLEARGPASPHGPALPAAEGPGGGNVRRRGRPPGSGKKVNGAEGTTRSKAPSDSEAALPEAIKKLLPKDGGDVASAASSSRIVPTEEQRSNARRLFREIGERFNENRKKSKTAAYAAYRHDLMANLDTLIMGGAIDLKEVTTVITNLELLTKETEAESTETPATILGKWLRMDAAEVAGLVPVEESVEDEENDEDEDQEGQQSM